MRSRKLHIFSLSAALLLTGSSSILAEARDFTLPPAYEPLTELENTQTINLADHGLTPDTQEDIQPVLDIIPGLITNAGGPVEIIFPKGKYFIGRSPTDKDRDYAVNILNGENFIINGNGSEFIIRNPRLGFITVGICSNIIVKNFSVDYETLPFTQGYIDRVDPKNKAVFIKIDKGFPRPDEPWFKKAKNQFSGLRLASDPRRTKPGAQHTLHYGSLNHHEGDVYRLNLYSVDQIGNTERGDRAWIIARHNGRCVVRAASCDNVTVSGVTAYSSISVVFALYMCDRGAVQDCKTLIKEGRLISVNADVVHAQRNLTGPIVKNCEFEGCIDDIMNLYGFCLPLMDINDPKHIRVLGHAGHETLHKHYIGTTITILDPDTGKTVYRGKIEAVSGSINPVITLDTPLELDNPKYAKDGDMKSGWTSHLVNMEAFMCKGFRVINNVLRHGHRYGIIVPSSHGIVEGNLFEDISASAIIMINRMNSYPHHIKYNARGDFIVRNNTITDCNASNTYAEQNTEGAIHISFHNRFFQDVPEHELENILIEGNTIRNLRQTGIFVSSARNVIIRNNKLICDDKNVPLYGANLANKEVINAGICVRNSKDVSIQNNIVEDVRKQVKDIDTDSTVK